MSELGASELHAASLGPCQRVPRSRCNHRALLLRKRGEQMQDEGVHIQERVRAGLQRAKRERAALAGGLSVRKTAAKFDVNPSTVQRISRPFGGAEHARVAGAA